MDKNSELYDIKPLWSVIYINGEKLLLEYDYSAYAMVEEAIAKSIYELRDDFLSGKVTLTNHLVVLYCGLLKHQKNFPLEKLKNYPRVGNLLAETLEPMLEAFFTPLLPPRVGI